jgi:hypothetical protein
MQRRGKDRFSVRNRIVKERYSLDQEICQKQRSISIC